MFLCTWYALKCSKAAKQRDNTLLGKQPVLTKTDMKWREGLPRNDGRLQQKIENIC